MNSKPFYTSKTFWTATVIPIAVGAIPGGPKFVADNPEAVVTIMSAIFVILRIITKGKVTIV